MNDFSELRREERKQATGNMAVQNVMTGEMLGRVGNLSPGGLLLICDQELRDNALYQIRFDLKKSAGSKATPIEIGVHEQWTQQAADPGRFWSGMRIIDISPEAEDQLLAWLG